MENSEITETPEILIEEQTETTELVETTITEAAPELTTLIQTETMTTTVTECSNSKLDGLNVDALNDFVYLGSFTSIFIILVIVFGGLRKLFNIFF